MTNQFITILGYFLAILFLWTIWRIRRLSKDIKATSTDSRTTELTPSLELENRQKATLEIGKIDVQGSIAISTILLAEGDGEQSYQLKNYLSTDYNVLVASPEKKNLIELTEKNKVDLVIMDLDIPEMDSVRWLEYKKNPSIKDIPIIFLTGFTTPRKTDIKNTPRTHYMLKPFTITELKQTIIDFLVESKVDTKLKNNQ